MTGETDVRRLLDACVHCGLCLPACPTYDLTGNELDGPRGRIDLVRGLAEGRIADSSVAASHLDRCLGCRACETACPSGVRYGQILEAGRAAAPSDAPVPRGLLRGLSSPARTMITMRALWIARRLGLVALGRTFPGPLGAAARVAPDPSWTPWSRGVADVLPATGARRGAVTLLPGCVMDQGFARVHEATVRVVRAAGFDVRVPRGPLCCGALHAHGGDAATAASLAARLAEALAGNDAPLLVNAAGCGSHLKETPGPWSGRVFDVLEFLAGDTVPGTDSPAGDFVPGTVSPRRLRVAYQDACHLLHGQRIRDAPRRLLARVPGVELVELGEADRCCGSAGTYNIAQPELADEMLRRKVALVRAAAPDVLASANPGCMLQLASGLRDAGLRVPVVHVVEVLAGSAQP